MTATKIDQAYMRRAMDAVRDEMQSCMSLQDAESGLVSVRRLREHFAPRIAHRVVYETFKDELYPPTWGGGTSD